MNTSSSSGSARFRTGSPTAGPTSPRANGAGAGGASISDMDVRSLKTLYTPGTPSLNGSAGPNGAAGAVPGVGAFTVEAFAARVQALVADDRALIERLIRFAPMFGRPDAAYAKVMTANLRLMKKLGRP